MTETEWTPARGWAKLALYLPIRVAIGLAVILGIAWAYDALLTQTGAAFAPWVLTAGLGALAGVLAGVVLCVRLSDSVGHAGRTILPVIWLAIIALHAAAWYAIAAVIPWGPTVILGFVGTSGILASAAMLRFCWVGG